MIFAKNLIIVVAATIYMGGNFNTYAKSKSQIKPVEPDHKIKYERVDREKNLEEFFRKYNSPLVENVDTFIEVADEYGMDYRLLPAISCIESSCGKALIKKYNNPFGWGVYGDQHLGFKDFDEAIETVGKGIHEGYIMRGANTVEKIAPIYTPPNSLKWASSVNGFMRQINRMGEA